MCVSVHSDESDLTHTPYVSRFLPLVWAKTLFVYLRLQHGGKAGGVQLHNNKVHSTIQEQADKLEDTMARGEKTDKRRLLRTPLFFPEDEESFGKM